jgi:hypothetical protein
MAVQVIQQCPGYSSWPAFLNQVRAEPNMKCFFALLVVFSHSVYATDSTWMLAPEKITIFRSAIRVGGGLTKEMHERFWSYMPAANGPDDLAAFDNLMKRSVDADLGRQRAMWLSFRSTLQGRSVVVDPSYARAQRAMQQLVERGELSQEKVLEKDAEFRSQLALVAEGRPLTNGDRVIEVTPELIDQVVSGLNASYERMTRLLEPTWEP